jgi:hypothetical protein
MNEHPVDQAKKFFYTVFWWKQSNTSAEEVGGFRSKKNYFNWKEFPIY